ncbi:hypothetical protein [Marinomonas ostreistagni]|uniref:hypothetical protein n=1 Tax=Marinomonas ostreistagni TaxID=359209 RepID=UPI0019509525|nr:hypothetical protein [Marinomonas ostreistagni]MBM6550475.1 hypothetical protein [Marinomonas ostreistagni]
MNKSKMLNAYKTVNKLKQASQPESDTQSAEPQLYRSDYDEKLIKEYHFAKFQKNLDQIQHNPELTELLEKAEWSDEDVQRLLALFR